MVSLTISDQARRAEDADLMELKGRIAFRCGIRRKR